MITMLNIESFGMTFFWQHAFGRGPPLAWLALAKGQLISKANCQAVNSSKKQTIEFVFTTMRRVFVCFFWKKVKTPKKPFEII